MNGRYLDCNSRNFFTYLLNLCCGAIGWNMLTAGPQRMKMGGELRP